nr:hypothetical protein [uncultured Oscillibacter sp.]
MVILFAALAVLIYLLYRQGFAVTESVTAVLFVFQPGKQSDRASLDSCTGWMRHAGRFRDSRVYAFSLDCRLSKGSAEVLLLDRQKQELLRLNQDRSTGEIELDGSSRYYLRWEFRNATGKCELRW